MEHAKNSGGNRLSLQQIDYKRLASEVYALMQHDQDEETKEEEEEESEEKKKKEETMDSKQKDGEREVAYQRCMDNPEKYQQFMKSGETLEDYCRGYARVSASLSFEDAAGEVKQEPATLQFSPQGAGVDPTDPTITPPEDAEGLCVEAKVAKGIPEAQARAECAAERTDKGPQTAPEDAKAVMSLESLNARLDSALGAMSKLIGWDRIKSDISDEEYIAKCVEAGHAEIECREMLPRWRQEELLRTQERLDQLTFGDSMRASKDTLIDFLIQKSHQAFTRDYLQGKDLCYLRALDSVLDKIYAKAKDAPTGRPPRFPAVDSSQVEKVEFKKLTVGKRNKDTGEWEPIK